MIICCYSATSIGQTLTWQYWTTTNLNKPDSKFLNILQKNFLNQHVIHPTRVRGTDEPHILDLVITNDSIIENLEMEAPLGNSDHNIITVDCRMSAINYNETPKFNFSKGDFCGLRDSLKLNWNDILLPHQNNIEEMWNIFKNVLLSKAEQFIPKNSNFNVWKKKAWDHPLAKDLRGKISRKNRLWTRYIETRNPDILQKYKTIRNLVRRETRNINKKEQQNIAAECKVNPKKFWKYINKRRKTNSRIGELKTVDSSGNPVTATEDIEKANVLGQFFSSVFTDEKIVTEEILKRNINFPMNSISFDEKVILEKLCNINVSKSSGPDNLHPRILYETRNEIVHPLKIIYETSYNSGSLPSDWRTGSIVAVHKTRNKNDPANYRPISLTCVICKIMESIIRDSIIHYFFANRFFSDKQYGFIKGRSITLQLLRIMDEWTEFIYTDFAKAFDKVPHQRLLAKLRSYGITKEMLQWIENFLCNHKQCVIINGVLSEWVKVISGIPQGSILGPILFLIYTVSQKKLSRFVFVRTSSNFHQFR